LNFSQIFQRAKVLPARDFFPKGKWLFDREKPSEAGAFFVPKYPPRGGQITGEFDRISLKEAHRRAQK